MEESPDNYDANDQVLHRYVRRRCMLGEEFFKSRFRLTTPFTIRASKAYAERGAEKTRSFALFAKERGQASGRIWPRRRPKDINELDNLLLGLLECLPHYDSWVREEGAVPSRSRRCEWGRNP